jgi:DNA-binding transcriptional LysR family regulator
MFALSQGQPARWDEVRVFLALYRERTLAAAGAALELDASTLSRRLAALEESLATRLFDRTRDGLAPTESAELLLPAAEEMAAAHSRFLADASGFERAAEGVVRLSTPPGLAESFVAPALVRLRKKYARIQIELDASVRFTDLTRREADLAIRTQRPSAGDLVCVKIGERRWTPMIARAAAKKRSPTKDWGNLSWIAWADDLQSFAPARWLQKHVPRSAVVLATSHFSTQVSAVEAGLGAALLPPVYERLAAVTPVRYGPRLAASADELPTSETWLVGHRALRTVPRVAAVWTFLVEEFARFELPGAGARVRAGSARAP